MNEVWVSAQVNAMGGLDVLVNNGKSFVSHTKLLCTGQTTLLPGQTWWSCLPSYILVCCRCLL